MVNVLLSIKTFLSKPGDWTDNIIAQMITSLLGRVGLGNSDMRGTLHMLHRLGVVTKVENF